MPFVGLRQKTVVYVKPSVCVSVLLWRSWLLRQTTAIITSVHVYMYRKNNLPVIFRSLLNVWLIISAGLFQLANRPTCHHRAVFQVGLAHFAICIIRLLWFLCERFGPSFILLPCNICFCMFKLCMLIIFIVNGLPYSVCFVFLPQVPFHLNDVRC